MVVIYSLMYTYIKLAFSFNPLQSAHMAVIEAMMQLYAKEVVTPDRVVAAVQRFSHSRSSPPSELPVNHEESLLLWLKKSCAALKQKIDQEIEQTDKSEVKM